MERVTFWVAHMAQISPTPPHLHTTTCTHDPYYVTPFQTISDMHPPFISWLFLMRSYELPVYSPIIQTTDLGRREKQAHITRLPWSFSSICWQSNSTTASRRSSNIHRWAHRGKIKRQQSASLTLWNSSVKFGPQWLLLVPLVFLFPLPLPLRPLYSRNKGNKPTRVIKSWFWWGCCYQDKVILLRWWLANPNGNIQTVCAIGK